MFADLAVYASLACCTGLLNESVTALPAVSNSLTRLDAVCQKTMKSYDPLRGKELRIQRAASNAINKGPYHPHHVTLGAYEKNLEPVSFTDSVIHPLSCCKVEMLPQHLPSPTLLCQTQINVYAHTLTQWPFSVFYTATAWQWIMTQIYAAELWRY